MVAGGGAALLALYALLRRKPKTADDLERERRAWLEGSGRITDGTVIDVQELAAADNHHAAIMLIYKYDVAGVSYECSQDVTYLRHWINLHSCRLGMHTSVKYDPPESGKFSGGLGKLDGVAPVRCGSAYCQASRMTVLCLSMVTCRDLSPPPTKSAETVRERSIV